MRLNLNIKNWIHLRGHWPAVAALLLARFALASASVPATRVAPPIDRQDTGRRLVHLLDYVSRDYAGAVGKNHDILAASEYAEQREFTATIATLAGKLPELQGDEQIKESLGQLQSAVENRAAPPEVGALCLRLRGQIITRLAILAFPVRAPDLAAGAAYFKPNCAPCHGLTGHGDGPSAAQLNPKPSNLAGDRLTGISPFQITNTVRFGVNGTGMAAHSELTDEQLWNIAFYTETLHIPDAATAPVAASVAPAVDIPLIDLATHTDRELLAANSATPDFAGKLAWSRLHPPPPASEPLDFSTARDLLAKAQAAYQLGDREGAQKLALSAYLDGVEPFEVTLNTHHAAFVGELETGLSAVRGEITKGVPVSELVATKEKADQLLYRGDSLLAQRDLSPLVTLLTALAILLREGLEAVLIVVMLLGIAGNTGSRQARVATHFGWLTALALGFVTWGVSHWLLNFSGAGRELMEGLTALVAVGVLLYVGFWLHSKTEIGRWHAYLKAKSLVGAGGLGYWGMFSAAFLAVYREAFETVLFFQTLWLEAGTAARNALLAGIGLGAIAVGLISVLLLRLGRKVPLRSFFLFSSLVMLLLAVILCGKGVHSLQEAGWLGYHPFGMVRLEFFGIYPTLQTLIPQFIVLLICLSLWYFGGRADTTAPNKAILTGNHSLPVSNPAQ